MALNWTEQMALAKAGFNYNYYLGSEVKSGVSNIVLFNHIFNVRPIEVPNDFMNSTEVFVSRKRLNRIGL